ncbi:MAG TPA: HAD family hydrolase [Rhodospirillaceae bacterium]|nr:HAD family hydrolase [Rhodospirillaceae bacterium]
MMPTTAPAALIFDWDNTLVDSWGCIQAAMNVTLTRMGHAPWDLDEIKGRVALSLRDSFPVLFGERWPEARDIFYKAYSDIHLQYLAPLPGIETMLGRLAELGLKMAVVSNKNGGYLREEAQHLGWQRWFTSLVGATDAAADKPSPAPVQLTLERLGLAEPKDIWFVGDAAVDMECAANSGCIGVLLRGDPWRDGEFERFPPRLHFNLSSQLSDLVEELLVPISQI